MRVLLFAVSILVASCGTEQPLLERLEDACASQVCPADPPEYINCMPIVPEAWQPICEPSCREFLQQTCKIPFAD